MSFIVNKILAYRVLFLFSITMLYANCFSQSLDSIKVVWHARDLGRAREMVDEYVSKSDSDVAGWFAKAGIYNDISFSPKFQGLFPDSRSEAFNSIKTAIRIDSDSSIAILKKANFRVLTDIFEGYTNVAIAYFNAGVENNQVSLYKKAFEIFKKADEVSALKGALQADNHIDSNSLYNLAISAIYSKNEDQAEFYSRKVADNLIKSAAAHKSIELIYQWLVFHYKSLNDSLLLNKYTLISKGCYPNSGYFDLNYIEWLRSQKRYSEAFVLYNALFKRGLMTKDVQYAYIQDILSFLGKNSEIDPITKKHWDNLLKTELTDYNKKYPTDITVKYLLSNLYHNRISTRKL